MVTVTHLASHACGQWAWRGRFPWWLCPGHWWEDLSLLFLFVLDPTPPHLAQGPFFWPLLIWQLWAPVSSTRGLLGATRLLMTKPEVYKSYSCHPLLVTSEELASVQGWGQDFASEWQM